ncbi:MAG: hypothetical protein ACRED8_12370, partial [Caulobacteraceae bacterium]
MQGSVPLLRYDEPIVDPGTGKLTRRAFAALSGLRVRTGGDSDKVDQAFQIASAAVPQSTEVVASGGLKGGGPLNANAGIALY